MFAASLLRRGGDGGLDAGPHHLRRYAQTQTVSREDGMDSAAALYAFRRARARAKIHTHAHGRARARGRAWAPPHAHALALSTHPHAPVVKMVTLSGHACGDPRVVTRVTRACASCAPRSLDLLLAQRILTRWEHGEPAPHHGGAHRRGATYARTHLRLQSFPAPASWGGAEAETAEPCAICLDAVLPGQRCVAGPACLHRLHEECALEAAAHTSLCPTCRSPLLAVDCRAPGEAPAASCGATTAPGEAVESQARARETQRRESG
jgi:hypothetical protein